MMQEYEDDFFFEEDKIDAKEDIGWNKLLLPIEQNAIESSQKSEKGSADTNLLGEKLMQETVEDTILEPISTECVFNDLRKERYMIYHQDLMGMTVTSGSVVLSKDEKNLIGISIGGGAPYCPCLYIVQIFDNTPASKEGTLQSGDELVGVGSQSVKGKTKLEVAKMIQSAKANMMLKGYPHITTEICLSFPRLKIAKTQVASSCAICDRNPRRGCAFDFTVRQLTTYSVEGRVLRLVKVITNKITYDQDEVTINYNKLHADPKQGKSLDIIMKKMKHRLVENMSSGAADALGLSRAILCNDTLVAKLDELRDTETTYKRLVENAKRMLKAYFDLLVTYKSMGDIFAGIGVREPQARASEAFSRFGQYHRELERDGIKMLKALKPILSDMGTYLNKAIPDTKLTIRKYADTKFEYLSYCLKVKEMDDEEYGYNALQEPLYRVETGNYEYRLILRCRQDARCRFARLRSDVLVKLELLENKKAQDVAYQLRRFIEGLAAYQNETLEHLNENVTLFPVEVDLSQNAFQYKSTGQIIQDNAEDEDDIEYGREIKEYHDISDSECKEHKVANRKPKEKSTESQQLLPEFDISDRTDTDSNDRSENLKLLTELGLADDFGDFQNGAMDDFAPKTNDVDDVFERILSDLNIGK